MYCSHLCGSCRHALDRRGMKEGEDRKPHPCPACHKSSFLDLSAASSPLGTAFSSSALYRSTPPLQDSMKDNKGKEKQEKRNGMEDEHNDNLLSSSSSSLLEDNIELKMPLLSPTDQERRGIKLFVQ